MNQENLRMDPITSIFGGDKMEELLRIQIEKTLEVNTDRKDDSAFATGQINRKDITNPMKQHDFIWNVIQGFLEILLEEEQDVKLRTNQPEMLTVRELFYEHRGDYYEFKVTIYYTEVA